MPWGSPLRIGRLWPRLRLRHDDEWYWRVAGQADNVITLTGHVCTWAGHDAVLGAAWMARGVIDVRDELQVPADR
jgi:hypothetical protein